MGRYWAPVRPMITDSSRSSPLRIARSCAGGITWIRSPHGRRRTRRPDGQKSFRAPSKTATDRRWVAMTNLLYLYIMSGLWRLCWQSMLVLASNSSSLPNQSINSIKPLISVPSNRGCRKARGGRSTRGVAWERCTGSQRAETNRRRGWRAGGVGRTPGVMGESSACADLRV
jgi:hypothetical protein